MCVCDEVGFDICEHSFIEIRESHFTAKSQCMLFQDISPEKIFNFLKEMNIFGKIKFEIIFSYVYVCVIHFLSMVLKMYIDPF